MAQNYDPVTGLPIQPMQPMPPSTAYSPTGNPFVPNVPAEDPMSVMNNPFLTPEEKLLYSSAANPYTAPAANSYATAYGPSGGTEWETPKKGKKGRIILLVILLVVLIAGALFYILYWNNPRVVLKRAGEKTLADGGYLTDDLGKYKPAKIKKGIEYDLDIRQNGESVSMEGSLACDGSAVQFIMDASAEEDVCLEAEINKSEILLNMAPFTDRTIVYNYTSDDYGYLDDEISQEKLNEGIKELYNFFVKGKVSSTLKKEKKDIAKIAKDIKIESIGSKEFEVDGKDRKCKGYELTGLEDSRADAIEVFTDYIEERFDGLIEDNDEIEDEVRQYLRSLRSAARNGEDLEIRYWLYKGEFACIELDNGYSKIGIHFLGGDFRLQNIEIYEDKELLISIEGERDGDEDVFYIYDCQSSSSSEVAIISYDKSKGELLIEDPDDRSNYLSFVIESDKDHLNIDVDISIDDVSVEGTVQICNNPQLFEFDVNDPLNLDSASEHEIEEFGEECEENMRALARLANEAAYGTDPYDDFDDFDYYDDFDDDYYDDW